MNKFKKIFLFILIILLLASTAVFIATKPPTDLGEKDEIVMVKGKKYKVEYVPKEEIYPAFGYAQGDTAKVRQDLGPRVKQFVRSHELYHCRDHSDFGGWMGGEFRANFIPGLKDPFGLAATAWATLSDADRMKLYLQRFREGK